MTRDARRGVAALAVSYAIVFGTALVGGVRTIVTGASWAQPHSWADTAATLEGYLFDVLVVVVVLRWLRRAAPAVAARMQLRRPSRPASAVGTTVYVTIAVLSQWIALRHTPAPESHGLVADLAGSIAAGITEEVVLVALAGAVFAHLWRRHRWAPIGVVLALTILRWSVHLYYGGDSLFVLLWAPAVVVLYRQVGSVWPLVAGHVGYDVVLSVHAAYPATSAVFDRTLWVTAALGAALVIGYLVRPRRQTVRHLTV